MKAILIVDIGNDEYLLNKEIDAICFKDGDKIYDNFNFLKPMPQRKTVGKIKEVDDFMKSEIQVINEEVTAKIMLDTELLLASGYNLCIDEILGDNNE